MESLENISLEGFKVVSGSYFHPIVRMNSPIMTIWDGHIGFSKKDVTLLNGCENIIMQINSDTHSVVISPTTSFDKDAVRWINKKTMTETRKIACKKLTDMIYSLWAWDKKYIYRTIGRPVTASNRIMILFDFSAPECWARPEEKTNA